LFRYPAIDTHEIVIRAPAHGKISRGGPGYRAQNNTQTIFVDPDSVTRFQTELIAEHMAAQRAAGAKGM
jgi:hypothetical protein